MILENLSSLLTHQIIRNLLEYPTPSQQISDNLIEDKIYFTTSFDKKVGKQIIQNQKSELCYLSSDFSEMLRITTTLEILDDKKIKQYLIDTREYLKHFHVDDPSFILFSLSNSQATFWKLTDNLKEDSLEKILF